MKFQSNTLLPELSRANIKSLTRLVNETPDILIREIQKKKISAGELWMIHKTKRNFSVRRFI